MFFTSPPMNVSSVSTIPASFLSNDRALIAARTRWSMNHAVFCVTSSARAISYDETPFLQLATIQTTRNHFPSGSGESSKIVPTRTENCFLHALHFHTFRVLKNDCSEPLQNGQNTPSGQRRDTANSNALSSLAK